MIRYRVTRGGAWNSLSLYARPLGLDRRCTRRADSCYYYLGFRLARSKRWTGFSLGAPSRDPTDGLSGPVASGWGM